MSGTTIPPVVFDSAGPQPTAPATLNALVRSTAEALVPGLTTNLPGSLIDDVAGTATGALVLIDQARVDLINSLTPNGANPWLLRQLGQIYGVTIDAETNTSVAVVFTATNTIGGAPLPGYVIPKGFVVSDGTYQYVVQDGGVTGASGTSSPITAVATVTGSFAVPAGTVTNIVTSVPSAVTLTVTNPLSGTPGIDAQDEASYRAAVMSAGLCGAQGFPLFLKTLLNNVTGVQSRLVSVRQMTNQWEILVGGSGDPYEIGYAIFSALFDVSSLVGSTLSVTGITKANPGVVTTNLTHGFATGQVITINGATGMTAVNGTPFTITVLSSTTFSIGVNTTGYATYTGGGVVTPNFRNQSVSITDYPDVYTIPYVIPPQQTVTMTVTWNTTLTGFTSGGAIPGLAIPALVQYVNNITVGQPLNLFELEATFQEAVASVLAPQYLTRLVFAVAIDGVGVSPTAGTGIIAGDPESFLFSTATGIIVNQG